MTRIACGLGALGLGFLNFGLTDGGNAWGLFFSGMCTFLFAAAFSLVLVRAGVSTECEHMLDSLNQLRKSADYHSQNHISQLESFLKGCNRDQGIGFQVGGAVINRQ
jgi:hypothetical protein